MGFSIFSKPIDKTRTSARVKGKAGSPATLELIKKQAVKGEALHRFTTTREGTATERARAAALLGAVPSLEVGGDDTGLSAALENAALLHASGQSAVAMQLLGAALANDPETRTLPRAWHAQFDLLQRAADRDQFEQLALEYVTAFEASPPAWSAMRKEAARASRATGGYFAVTQINANTALEIPARAARFGSLKIDVASVSVIEDVGCRRMVDVLRRLRRHGYPISWQGLDALKRQIAEKIATGLARNEGIWLFELELLQWQNDSAAFEDRAIEYAVAFEVSPSSWEPLAASQLSFLAASSLATAAKGPVASSPASNVKEPASAHTAARRAQGVTDAIAFKGILAGPADAQIASLNTFAAGRTWVSIDMAQVDRIDFVCAGALQNAVSEFVSTGRQVQIVAASPIVEALLILIGVDPEAFARTVR